MLAGKHMLLVVACVALAQCWHGDAQPDAMNYFVANASNCVGTAYPCQAYAKRSECQLISGCQWSGSTCWVDGNEDAATCVNFTSSATECTAHGCSCCNWDTYGCHLSTMYGSPNCDLYSSETQCTIRQCTWTNLTQPPSPTVNPAPPPALAPAPGQDVNMGPSGLVEVGGPSCTDGQIANDSGTACIPSGNSTNGSTGGDQVEGGATAKMWAAICGSVTATPFIFIIGYLAITFAYKSEKRMIVDEVKRHLIMADIATDINASKGLEIGLVAPVQAVAGQLVWKCLQVWDGFLGFRAISDSHGDRSGIWLSKFKTVRYASMLLAMQRCNAYLQHESGGDNTLFQAWTNAHRCPAARDSLVMCVVHELLNISEAEAQALPKDPEVPGLQYKLCGMCQSCCTCCCRSSRKSSAHVELLWNPGSPAHV